MLIISDNAVLQVMEVYNTHNSNTITVNLVILLDNSIRIFPV